MMNKNKFNLPADRKNKIELLKQIQSGRSITEVLSSLLPDEFVLVDQRQDKLFYQDKEITQADFDTMIKDKSKASNVTIMQVIYSPKYGYNEALPITNENQIPE